MVKEIECDKCKHKVLELTGVFGNLIKFLMVLSILGVLFIVVLGFIKLFEIVN